MNRVEKLCRAMGRQQPRLANNIFVASNSNTTGSTSGVGTVHIFATSEFTVVV